MEKELTPEERTANLSQIEKLVTYWFSNSNYPTDKFLNAQAATDDGWINLSVFATFNKMKPLTTDPAVIAEGAKLSPNVIVSEDGLKVKKKDPVPSDLSFEGRVLVLRRFPDNAENTITIEAIQALFPDYKLLSVKVLRDKKIQARRYVEIEFETAEQASAVVQKGDVAWPASGTNLTVELKRFKFDDEKDRVQKKQARKAERDDLEGKQIEVEQPKPGNEDWKIVTPNVLLKLAGLPNPKSSRFEVESFFNKFGKVKHVDAGHTDETLVVVRFAEADAAKEAFTSITNDNKQLGGHAVEASMILGDDEQKYWTEFVIRDPATQSGRGGRGGRGRGRGGRGGRGSHGRDNKKQRTEK